MKRTVKYLAIAVINVGLLSALLALWTDKLELTFHEWVRPIEFLKVLLVTALSLVVIGLLFAFFRRKQIRPPVSPVKLAIILMLLCSSYLYVTYGWKILHNVMLQGAVRSRVADKIRDSHRMAYGSMATDLTREEYQMITLISDFPDLPAGAQHIQYADAYDGFLPDHTFNLQYDLPKEVNVDTFHYSDGRFSKWRIFEVVGGVKRVEYGEERH